jgi:hypothetical protein
MAEATATTNMVKENTPPSNLTVAESNSAERRVKGKPGETWRKNEVHEIPHK